MAFFFSFIFVFSFPRTRKRNGHDAARVLGKSSDAASPAVERRTLNYFRVTNYAVSYTALLLSCFFFLLSNRFLKSFRSRFQTNTTDSPCFLLGFFFFFLSTPFFRHACTNRGNSSICFFFFLSSSICSACLSKQDDTTHR